MPARITSQEKKRGSFAPIGCCLRTIGLTAFVLAVASPRGSAAILLETRFSEAWANVLVKDKQGMIHLDNHLMDQLDFLPANLVTSASATGDGGSANATAASNSTINLDNATDSLSVSGNGNGSGSGSAEAPATFGANGNPHIILLHFTVTDKSYSYSLTGHLSGQDPVGTAYATLSGPNGSVFNFRVGDEGGPEDSVLSQSGTLDPGAYVFEVTTSANTGSGAVNPAASNADFNFTVIPVGAPTPTPSPSPIEWINPTDGSFQTAENWDPQTVPSENDDAIFDVPGTYTVSLDGDASHNALFGSGTGVNVTFELSGNTYTLNQLQTGGLAGEDASFTFSGVFDPASIALGPTGLAPQGAGGLVQVNQTLFVGEGTKQSYVEQAQVSANLASVEGSLTVRDVGSLLTASTLEIGILEGAGFLDIDAGEVISTQATILGGVVSLGSSLPNDPSHWEVGDGLDLINSAAVFISGGSVNVGGRCVIGDDSPLGSGVSIGLPPDEGTNEATFSATELIVARNGKGTMTVSSTGLAQIGSLEIGNDPDSSDSIGDGLVTVVDGTLLVGNDLIVGGSGTGVLSVEGGVLSNDGPLALMEVNQDSDVQFFGGTGNLSAVNVNLGGTMLINSANNSAAVVNANGLIIFGAVGIGGDGFLKVSSGTVVSSPGLLDLGTSGQVDIGEGSGAAGQVRIGPNGILSGDGLIVATEIVTAGSGSNQFIGGQIIPGNSPGTLTLQGNFTQELGSSLIMEIAGLAEGEFDVLHVTGASVLDGTMEVRMLGNFLPATGQTFDLLQLDGSVSGEFSEIAFPDLKPGFEFSAEQSGGVFKVTALNNGLAANALLNISTRAQVRTGDNVLIAGFIVQGNEPKTVLLRGIGPSLTAFGVLGALANPTLELRDSDGSLIFANDDWMNSPQKQQIIDSTIPPTDDLESAILATLDPGAYTTILRGANDGTGVGLVEVYDLGPEASVNMLNISTRGDVQTGDDVMIAGFIATGTTQILTRAIGPSLTEAGLADILADPTLEVFDANGASLLANDNWKDTQQSEIEATAIPPPNDLEAAAILTLETGAYTIIVRGVNETSGIGLVEVYKL